ncbi:START domain-containing protein, partial [Bacteroidota bacterium]
IYHRISENSALKELKLSTIIKSTLTATVSTITNIDSFPKWAYLCVETSVVRVVSEVEFYYYYVSDTPWPMTDRDIVIHMNISQDSTSGIVTIDTEKYNGFIAERKKYIRIKSMKGKWVLTPLKNGLIQLEYYISMDPGGIIPAFLVNYGMIIGPINSIASLVERVEKKSKLSPEKLDYIKEFSF